MSVCCVKFFQLFKSLSRFVALMLIVFEDIVTLSICMSLMSDLANHFSFDNEISHGRKQSPRVLGSRVSVPQPVTSSFLFQNSSSTASLPLSIFIQIADALFCLFIQTDEYIRVNCQGVKLIKYRHFLFSDASPSPTFCFPPVCYLGDPSEAFQSREFVSMVMRRQTFQAGGPDSFRRYFSKIAA